MCVLDCIINRQLASSRDEGRWFDVSSIYTAVLAIYTAVLALCMLVCRALNIHNNTRIYNFVLHLRINYAHARSMYYFHEIEAVPVRRSPY